MRRHEVRVEPVSSTLQSGHGHRCRARVCPELGGDGTSARRTALAGTSGPRRSSGPSRDKSSAARRLSRSSVTASSRVVGTRGDARSDARSNTSMNPLFAAAVEIEAFCRVREWRCCVIGGLATQRWGEPRQTRDVDLTILTGLGGEERFVDPILAHYEARIPDARQFALHRRVLLVRQPTSVPLDIALGGLPYRRARHRASHAVRVCARCRRDHLLSRGSRRAEGIGRPARRIGSTSKASWCDRRGTWIAPWCRTS